MILLVIISVLLLVVVLLICFILVTPVCLAVDTDKGLYTIYQPGFFSVRLFPLKAFRFEVRVAGILIPLDGGGKEETRMKKRHYKKRKTRSVDAWRSLIREIMDSIVIRELELNIDTDDFPLNAKLVPLFYWASADSCLLQVNFNGHNYLRVNASVRPVSLAWAYILFLTKQ
jgi:hypothetical protein